MDDGRLTIADGFWSMLGLVFLGQIPEPGECDRIHHRALHLEQFGVDQFHRRGFAGEHLHDVFAVAEDRQLGRLGGTFFDGRSAVLDGQGPLGGFFVLQVEQDDPVPALGFFGFEQLGRLSITSLMVVILISPCRKIGARASGMRVD